MKKSVILYSLGLAIILIIFHSCEIGKEIPTLTTSEVTNITGTTATCGGTLISEGSSTVIARGVCWSTGTTPSIGDSKTTDGAGAGTFISNISDLTANTSYFVRAYATNEDGTGYGMAMSFSTPLADIDGNIYSQVTIGTQVWMGENLKTTRYNDGTVIPLVANSTEWSNLTTPGYCWYNNDITTYKNTYGALYNGYAVITGKLCPTGWYVPSANEWQTLTYFVGDQTNAGGKLKEIGLTHWRSPNAGATNEVGFTALPGGLRQETLFRYIGESGWWWTSTNYEEIRTHSRFMVYHSPYLGIGDGERKYGKSIRCLKD